ncbi:MAG: hypothetical protein CSA34_02765 [Desulfobulbus propionicus]|nr:MAG: hypothetical protein CSA34_02765 [Desulfobulbus propionicus]
MKKLSSRFLSKEEEQAVTAAVQAAERTTSGEIVPMVVSASHTYPVAAMLGSAFLTLPLALVLTRLSGSLLWLGPDNMWLFLLFTALFCFPLYKLVDTSIFLKRLFLLRHQVEEEVGEAALTAFYTEGLYKTSEENGILLFISVLEKKAWILGDRGINARISADKWQEIVDELSAGIRAGQQAEALCQAVTAVGEILKHHFPIGDADRDELHNLIIR